MNQILRSFTAVVDDVDASDRSIVAKISAGDVDRYNSVIESRGIGLDSYRKNPVVLFEHGKDPNRGSLPIGRNLWIRAEKTGNGRILAKTRFASDEFSDLLWSFYRDGTMCGWSVMVLPHEASPPSREEIRSRPELAKCEIIYRLSEMGEYSATAVPGLASALSQPELRSLSKLVVQGFWTPSGEVAPLVERMCEADPAETPEADADEAADDSLEAATDGVTRSIDPFTGVEEITQEEADAKVAAMRALDSTPVVEITPEPETPADAPAETEAVSEADVAAEELLSDVAEFVADVVAADPEPEIVAEPPAPALPPLVGRTFEAIAKDAGDSIDAWQATMIRKIEDLDGWLHGQA